MQRKESSRVWVRRDGERLGPYREEDIVAAHERGALRPGDELWVEGLDDWLPAEAVFAQMQGPEKSFDELALEPMEAPVERETHAERYRAERAAKAARETPTTSVLSGAPYAGFWVRFAAVLADQTIVWVVTTVLLLPWRLHTGQPLVIGNPEPWSTAFTVLLLWLYFAVFESGRRSATPGKRLFNLQVLRAETRMPIGFLRASARLVLRYVSAFVLMIGYAMQPFTRRRQTLHDLATDTVVVARAPFSPAMLAIVIVAWLIVSIIIVDSTIKLGMQRAAGM